MPHYKLRRCDRCKKFHASYIVSDPDRGGKAYYCYDCWKATYAAQPLSEPSQDEEDPDEQAGNGQSTVTQP